MNPAHLVFMSRPVLCRLSELFDLLDAFDQQERHFVLGPAYTQVLKITELDGVASDENGYRELYRLFREKAMRLSAESDQRFVITGIVSTTLMWLYGLSDESQYDRFVENNVAQLEEVKIAFWHGKIKAMERDRRRAEIEERINNLRSDMELRHGYYDRFCDQVVAKLPERSMV